MTFQTVPEQRIRKFLTHLVNLWRGLRVSDRAPSALLQDRRNASRHLLEQYPEFFPDDYLKHNEWLHWARNIEADLETEGIRSPELTADEEDVYGLEVIQDLARRLECAWRDQDPRNRRWQLFLLCLNFTRAVKGNVEEPPPLTWPFAQAMQYLESNFTLARRCQREGCVAPYFFRGEKDKRYCSTECSVLATRKSRLESYYRNKKSTRKQKGRHGNKSKRRATSARKH
jgi:hypothetical protein